MKIVFFIFFSVIFLSCNRTSSFPTEGDVVKVVKNYFNPQPSFINYQTAFRYQQNPYLEKINIISINKKEGAGKLFDAIAIVEGKGNGFYFGYLPDFVDTLHLVIKNEKSEWRIEEKKHHFKSAKKDDNHNTLY